MFALKNPRRFAAPQIDKGTVDLIPHPLPGGEPNLVNAEGLAPAHGVLAVIVAEDAPEGSTWDVVEAMALLPVPGQSPPALAADRRHPEQFDLIERPSASRFASIEELRLAACARAQSTGQTIAWVTASGKRLGDLDASVFGDEDQGTETRDIYDTDLPAGSPPVGAAFLARTSPTTTVQHWVLFDQGLPMHGLRVVKRATPHASAQAFLSELQAKRAQLGLPFRHAFEQATHHPDVLAV